MKLEILKYLADMQASLIALNEYRQAATSFQAIQQNQMLKDAIEHRLSIIGEASYQANKLDKTLLITDKKKIMGLRHILIHDYDKVKPETLHVIINKHIDLLQEEVKTILKAHPPQGSLELDD